MQIRTIASIDDPQLLPYRTMKMQADHHRQRIFVAEGENVVRRLLESDLEVVSICLPEKWVGELRPLIEGRAEDVIVYVAEKEELERLTGFSMYQGVLAVGKVPPARTLDWVWEHCRRPYFFAATDGINNSENLGVLVRNAAAFGVQALLVGETCSSPFMRRAVRSSMGTIFGLPVVECGRLVDSLGELRRKNIQCLAAHPHSDRQTLYDVEVANDCCVVLGSEGFGISPAVLAACDQTVAIPMAHEIDSLNVGSAAAIFFFEANRQRLSGSRAQNQEA